MSNRTVIGGTCPARTTIDIFPGLPPRLVHRPHVSTTNYIISPHPPRAYACDHCRSLFVEDQVVRGESS